MQSGSPRWHLLRPPGNLPQGQHTPESHIPQMWAGPFLQSMETSWVLNVFNQQGGPAFHGWKDLFALQDPWEVSGPISTPEAQAGEAVVWETDRIPQGWGPERRLGNNSYRHWEEERCEQTQAFHGYPTGVGGGCSLGQGEWAWAWLLGEEPPRREVCLVATATAQPVGAGRPSGGTSTKGLWVQGYSQGPAMWPGSPEATTTVCVCVCVCVCVGQGQALSTLIDHARRLVGAWGGGSSLPLASLEAPAPQPPPAINGARSHFAEPGRDWDNGGD